MLVKDKIILLYDRGKLVNGHSYANRGKIILFKDTVMLVREMVIRVQLC